MTHKIKDAIHNILTWSIPPRVAINEPNPKRDQPINIIILLYKFNYLFLPQNGQNACSSLNSLPHSEQNLPFSSLKSNLTPQPGQHL